MSTTSESGFGARLRHAQDIVSFITSFAGYSPPRTQESVAGMNTLVTSIVASNNTSMSQKNAYALAVSQRVNAFRKTPASVERLLPLIMGAVESQYGKTSIEYKTIAAIAKRMRSTRLIRPPVDPSDPESAVTVSSSEQSYGSMTQFFNDLKTSLTGFTGYNPSNTSIKLAALNTLSTALTTLNNTVATSLLNLKNARSARDLAYTDLKDRVKRIKAYVKAQYGVASNEYKMVKGIKV